DIDLEPDEVGRDLGEALVESFPPAILDRDVATVDPAEFTQSLHKCGGPFASGRTRALAQETDCRHFARLLRACCKRPRRRRAAHQRDELSLSHSIPSSARSRIAVRSSMPIVLAVLRLTTSSNFVGCSTGRSAGLAPFKIFAT